ncbi:MAG: 3-deoxy-7-phosphoheptulonate synthase class II [Legionellaceae bacterium]
MNTWSPDSWLNYPYEQAARYANPHHLTRVVQKLSALPPLVIPEEVEQLKNAIARAGRGEAFILQGGDCAESFQACREDIIGNKLKILLQMSLVLLHGLQKPIIRIGRIAGQYTKPRSFAVESHHGITLPSYRGDLINAPAFNSKAREPKPELLLQGYSTAAMTLNFIRALLNSEFSNLHHPHQWDLDFFKHSKQADEYHAMVANMANTMETLQAINDVNFFTSHEALHLHYEQALTRQIGQEKHWYDLSTHLPWLGMRTTAVDSAHVEFLRGIKNPIGIKIGPRATSAWLKTILERLNPTREEGRMLLITRLGADNVSKSLPSLIQAVQAIDMPVTWSCDPMHGNTETTSNNIKTRHFDTMLLELKRTLTLHKEHNTHLGGVHFELTGENVTECIGGARGLTAHDLKIAYHSLVDPRLNYEQSMEMAFQLSRAFKT